MIFWFKSMKSCNMCFWPFCSSKKIFCVWFPCSFIGCWNWFVKPIIGCWIIWFCPKKGLCSLGWDFGWKVLLAAWAYVRLPSLTVSLNVKLGAEGDLLFRGGFLTNINSSKPWIIFTQIYFIKCYFCYYKRPILSLILVAYENLYVRFNHCLL